MSLYELRKAVKKSKVEAFHASATILLLPIPLLPLPPPLPPPIPLLPPRIFTSFAAIAPLIEFSQKHIVSF